MGLLVQHGTHSSALLLELTKDAHAKAALSHGWRYVVDTTREGGVWARFPLLLELLQTCKPGEEVVWWDADCVWRRRKISLADAFTFSQDAGVFIQGSGDSTVYQSGVLYLRNTDAVKTALTKCYEGRTQFTGLNGQIRFEVDAIVKKHFSSLKPAQLDPRWNETREVFGLESKNTVVRAFHGQAIESKLNWIKSLATIWKREDLADAKSK